MLEQRNYTLGDALRVRFMEMTSHSQAHTMQYLFICLFIFCVCVGKW